MIELNDRDINAEQEIGNIIVDEIGGTHDKGLGWNPNGVFCGECSNTTCVGCSMKDERN